VEGGSILKIELELASLQGSQSLKFEYRRMVNAGYVGKNQEEVGRHIAELAAKGIPGPKSTPTLYPVVCSALTTGDAIEAYGEKSSGEVEYVLLVEEKNRVFVGLGSDHTDRHLEEVDIPRAKQICPNVLSRVVWPLEEVAGHWDELLMRSYVVCGKEKVLYQQGRLGLLLNPAELMDFVGKKIGALTDTVIFSGTMGMLSADFLFGQRFLAELTDERLGRKLEIDYQIQPLDYLSVD
jgi:hypothetical protein